MQNILQLQDDLKNFSEQQLVREMQMPSGQVPQFLILTELGRRKRMKDDFTRQQAANAPTVAEETVAAAGMPVGASTAIAKSMAPKTSMAENTGIGTMMPRQPTRMAGGGVVKMAPGGSVGREGLQSAVEILKRLYPEIYEAVKDNPKQLLEAAKAAASSNVAREPEQTGIESLETDMTAQAAPFVPNIPMDTSGATRPVGPAGKMFNLPMGQIGEFFSDPFAAINPSTASYEDYELRYEPAKPGEYYYKGNAFILGPDGTMIERKTGVPISDITKRKIIAANATQVPIEGYGQLPTSNIAPLEKLIADQQEGAPVESVRTTTKDTAGKPVEIDPAAIAKAQVTPTPDTSGFEDVARIADAQRMMEINRIPERVTVPTLSEDTSVRSLSGFGSVPTAPSFDAGDSATIVGSPTTDFSFEPGSPAETDAIREFLRRKMTRVPSLIDEIDSGNKNVTSDRVIEDRLGARNDLYFDRDPIGGLLNRRAQEYLQSDMYTPKEEVYGRLIQGDPLEQAKYEEQSPEYINALSQQLAEQEVYAQQLADQEKFAKQDAEIRAADLIGGKITSDQPEEPVGTLEQIANFAVDKAKDVQNYLDERNLRKEADIERAGYESAAIKAAEMEEADAAKKTKTAELQAAIDKQVENVLSGGSKGSKTGSSGVGGLEGQLADMIKETEKNREQDKWLALANTGLALMASKSPTLGGALGEAGMAGMKQLREGKQQYSKDKMTVLALQQRIDASKRAAASKSSGLTPYQSANLAIRYRIEGEKLITDGTTNMNPEQVERGKMLLDAADKLDGMPAVPTGTANRVTVPNQ